MEMSPLEGNQSDTRDNGDKDRHFDTIENFWRQRQSLQPEAYKNQNRV
jgi:hypothetical protein